MICAESYACTKKWKVVTSNQSSSCGYHKGLHMSVRTYVNGLGAPNNNLECEEFLPVMKSKQMK